MSLSPQWLDELRSRVSLSGLIGRTTRVTKAGREFKACCPFHNEKTASFTINDEKGFYHCFGCGAHGDAIRWMTDQRGLSFMDAVKELAAEAGMEVPAADPRAAQRAQEQAGLHDVVAAAQEWFVAQLASPEGARARAYLATRGFSESIARDFGFGYAPEGRQALKGALGKFPESLLIEAGLRIVVEDREPYDRFRGRLMLPILDARGRVIAFGGRILDAQKTDAPKYLNSPDTPLFDKGRTLYNLHRAGPASRSTGRMIVVEGYMDAIAMAAAGIGECVAPLGTALTEHQIALLWRAIAMPALCFDGDAAGQRAAMRAAMRALPLLKPGHSLRFVTLPQGLDPDDMLKQRGRGALETLLDDPVSLLELIWRHERDAEPLTSPEAKAGLKARLMDHVKAIADEDIRALYRREWLDRYSDFAFPPRDAFSSGGNGAARAPFAPQRAGGVRRSGNGRFARDIPPPNPLPETMAHLRMAQGPHAGSLAAVAHGLARFPDEIARQAEPLHVLAAQSIAIDRLLIHAEEGGDLERDAVAPILRDVGIEDVGGLTRRGTVFAFLDPEECEGVARQELCGLIDLLSRRAQLEMAQARLDGAEPTEQTLTEQQRLRDALEELSKRELDLKTRVGQMADTRKHNMRARRKAAMDDTARENGAASSDRT